LHLENKNLDDKKYIKNLINSDNVDVRIIAGDIDSNPYNFNNFISSIDDVFYVKGNHDYYNNTLSNDIYRKEIYGTKILGCTLWTNFDNENPIVENNFRVSISDYRYIKSHEKCLIDHIKKINKQNFEMILDEQPEIVVTHHCPTLRSIHKNFIGDSLNFCFVNDYEKYLYDTKIKYWCFGHTHHRHAYSIGNTKFLCNPLGYINEIKEEYKPVIFEI
jgi:predicted phosphodiesterase